MKKYAYVIYRKWAYEIYKKIGGEILITTKEAEFKDEKSYVLDGNDNEKIYKILKKNNIEVVFFYGWSWIVREPILSNFLCLCLHPSKLPKYRGGSPLQNQIIDGKRSSAVTVFRMGEGIDDGDIYMQKKIALSGTLSEVLKRVTAAGVWITKKFINDFENGKVRFFPQIGKPSIFKRRREQQSEILIDDFSKMSFCYLNNFVRCLNDPYPSAFVRIGKKILYITEVKWRKRLPVGALVLNLKNKPPWVVKIKSGFALISKFRVKD